MNNLLIELKRRKLEQEFIELQQPDIDSHIFNSAFKVKQEVLKWEMF